MTRILIIDDDPDVCGVATAFLERAGHTVYAATDVSQAHSFLSLAPPDVVLLDFRMPDLNGLEFLPRIKALHPGILVLVITGVDDYNLETLFYEAGADGYLVKPFGGHDLVRSVDRLLSGKEA